MLTMVMLHAWTLSRKVTPKNLCVFRYSSRLESYSIDILLDPNLDDFDTPFIMEKTQYLTLDDNMCLTAQPLCGRGGPKKENTKGSDKRERYFPSITFLFAQSPFVWPSKR